MFLKRHLVRSSAELTFAEPEVSVAMQYLQDWDWIVSRESKKDSKGRPIKIYELAKPMTEIMNSLEKEIENKANNQLKIIKKLRNFVK